MSKPKATTVADFAPPKKLGILDKGFWSAWGAKLVFSLISVKVWGLAAATIVSTYLVLHVDTDGKHIFSGGNWLAFNSTVWGIIFGMKEVFKIAERRDNSDLAGLQTRQEANRMKAVVASQIAAKPASKDASPNGPSNVPVIDSQGKEVVGAEPDV